MAELKCLGTCAFFESHETSDAFPVLNFENKQYRTWSHPPKISLSSWVLKMNRSIFAVPSRVAERWTMHLTVLDLGSQVKRVVEISWVNHGLREGIPSLLSFQGVFTLWWTNKKLWKTTIFNGKIHYKWPFSIAMLVHQRVETMRFQKREGPLSNPFWKSDGTPCQGS